MAMMRVMRNIEIATYLVTIPGLGIYCVEAAVSSAHAVIVTAKALETAERAIDTRFCTAQRCVACVGGVEVFA